MEYLRKEEILDLIQEAEEDMVFGSLDILLYEEVVTCYECKGIKNEKGGTFIDADSIDKGYSCTLKGDRLILAKEAVSSGFCKRCAEKSQNCDKEADLPVGLQKIFDAVYSYCCKDLNVEADCHFYTNDNASKYRGGYQADGAIYVDISKCIDYEQKFVDTIAHELKHVDQHMHYPEIFNGYVEACDNFEEYYNHASEVEARDYATKIVDKYKSYGINAFK